MPSSSQPSSHVTGPSSNHIASLQKPMTTFFYKTPNPVVGGICSPSVSHAASNRARLMFQDPTSMMNNNNHGHFQQSGRFNYLSSNHQSRFGGGGGQTRDPRTAARDSTVPAPANPPDLMSMSLHSPSNTYPYWSNASAVSTTPSPLTTTTVHATANTAYGPKVNNMFPSARDSVKATTTNGQTKSYVNGTSKVNGSGGGGGSSSNPRPAWKERAHVGRYSLIRTIGKGNFAKVKLAQHLTTGMQVAVKVIDKTLLNHSSMHKLYREVRVLKTLTHPNIIKLLEVIESERHMYLVMEYASGGEVFDYLVTHGKLKEADARVKFRQIVSAVQYCHQKMVVHRDLKAENLLLDADLNIKIADFGFSNYFSTSQKLDTFCGSPPYAAPELFLGRKYEGPEVDVWSLGVILYTLVSGTLPFDGKNLKELRERVLRGTYRVPYYMTHECEMLLKKMLVLNPAKRLPLADVMRDPWLNNGSDEDLRPFQEPPADYCDSDRIATMVRLGFQTHEIQDALTQQRFNNITATYILLSRYDPKVHGRLPGLPHSGTSGSVINGGHQDPKRNGPTLSNPLSTKFAPPGPPDIHNKPTRRYSSRPVSALPTTHQQSYIPTSTVPTSTPHSRRTPDESLLSRNGSFAPTRPNTNSSQQPIQSTNNQQKSMSSVSSAVTSSSSSSAENPSVVVNHQTPTRPVGVRRSSTTLESKLGSTFPNGSNAPVTDTAVESKLTSSGTSVTELQQPVITMPTPSQAPPRDPTPPVSQTSMITIHPSSVTTAHLTLSSGKSVPAAASYGVRLSSFPSPSLTRRSPPLVQTTAAPIARGEEMPQTEVVQADTLKRLSHNGAMRPSEAKPTSMVAAAMNGDGGGRSSSFSSSSADSSSSDSSSATEDVYERQNGSAGVDSSMAKSSTSPSHGDSLMPKPAVKQASVVLAAAPCTSDRLSEHDYEHSESVLHQISPERSTKIHNFGRESNFSRMPSIRRRPSNRVTKADSTPNDSMPNTTTAADKRSTDATTVNCPKPVRTTSSVSKVDNNRSAATTPTLIDSRLSTNLQQQQPRTKPRNLFREAPNAADILSESNPFRLSTTETSNNDDSSHQIDIMMQKADIIGPSIQQHHQPTAGAIRRPIVPSPPLVSQPVSAPPPTRHSYAYHSLRLPSSTTATLIAMGDDFRADLDSRFPSQHPNTLNDDRSWVDIGAGGSSSTRRDQVPVTDMYSIPFSRNLPERTTIQHVPTGRARERLEGVYGASPRLVRHPGTQSIVTKSSGRTRPYSPYRQSDDAPTPRPASPDDLSIASSISTLGRNPTTSSVVERADGNYSYFSPPAILGEKSPTPEYLSAGGYRGQCATLDVSNQSPSRHYSHRRPIRDTNNGGLNGFFRTLTTRISRSKLFRRSTMLQQNISYEEDPELGFRVPVDPAHHHHDSMRAPTMQLDKVVVTRGSPSPDGMYNNNSKSAANMRLPRSRSGVSHHRPVSQVAPRSRHRLDTVLDEGPKTTAVPQKSINGEARNTNNGLGRDTITRRSSKRSAAGASREARSQSSRRPSVGCSTNHDGGLVDSDRTPSKSTVSSNDAHQRSSGKSNSTDVNRLHRSGSKSNRSMRFVLKPFARWPLDEVMVEVERALTANGVEFESIGEHKLQCVFGDPSSGCALPMMDGTESNNTGGGVVHWEMEIGKLTGVGVNGIRFKRINGSMTSFKQVAKKLADDLRF